MPTRSRRYFLLLLFIVVTVGGGLAIGYTTRPGVWYAALQKPWFNPPNWVFAPVWTLMYLLIAVAGWRTFLRDPGSSGMKYWYLQLALNFSWSPVFFGLQRIDMAFAVIVALLGAVLLFLSDAATRDRTSAALMAPYAVWIVFATILNGTILGLN